MGSTGNNVNVPPTPTTPPVPAPLPKVGNGVPPSGIFRKLVSISTTPITLPPSPTKVGTVVSPSGTIRKLLPIAAFFIAFATVMTLLLIYMDNTATRHHQFRVNMSQDYDLLSVSQDNPQLITYIREVHLRSAIEPHHRPLDATPSLPADTAYVMKLLNNKHNGIFVEAGAYSDGKSSKTEWLEKQLQWHGLLIQPDPKHYFNLRRHNRTHSQAVHACLSPTSYPKEVTFHQEERDGVKINSIHANSLIDDSDSFNTRVKCFPLYSLLLAMNTTNIDYVSLETGGTELQVLETVPFDRVKIAVIGVHLIAGDFEKDTIKNFLATKNFTLMESINTSYIYMMNRLKV